MSLNRACLSYAMARKSAIKWNTFALNAHPYCPGEALFIVVSLAAPLVCMGLEEAMSPRSVVTCCKSCSSCFLCVHVESHHFREEPQFFLSLLGQATTTGCGDRSLSLRRGSRSESLPYCADRHRHTFLYRFPSHLFS